MNHIASSASASFWLGCAVWSFRGWLGTLFPNGSRPSDFLSLYAKRLTAVEGNTTFYALPEPSTVERWRQQTPSQFRFCLKLPRAVTHQGLLQPHQPAVREFLNRVEPLGNRLGPCFAQLPPSYDPSQWPDLTAFLAEWPQTIPLTVEVRHLDWFRPPFGNRLNRFLAQQGVGRAILDTRALYDGTDDPQLHSQRRKPHVPVQPTLTAPFTLVRYISHPDLERNQPYLQQWVVQVGQWLRQGTEVYFFVHCPDERRSPFTARDFYRLLAQSGTPIPPLPWDELSDREVAGDNQLPLF